MLHPTDDLRIAGIKPLIPPAILMEELPISEPASATVSHRRDEVARRPRRARRPPGGDRRSVLHPRAGVGPRVRRPPDRGRRPLRRRPDRPHARLLREAAHHGGVEGADQRPRSRRHLPHQRGPCAPPAGCSSTWPTEASAPAPSSSTRSRPSSSPTSSPGGAIGARTHREPGPPRAGLGSVHAGGLQERHRRQHPTGHRRHQGRPGAPTTSSPSPSRGSRRFVATTGNDACHVILRGAGSGPNYDRATVDALAARLDEEDLPHRVMIDCSHGNSDKDHLRQAAVAEEVAAQISCGSDHLFGVMMESHLVEGRQDLVPRQAPGLRTEHHRRLHVLGADGQRPGAAGRGGTPAPRRPDRVDRPSGRRATQPVPAGGGCCSSARP